MKWPDEIYFIVLPKIFVLTKRGNDNVFLDLCHQNMLPAPNHHI